MSRRALERECARENEKVRRVKELNSLSRRDFWYRTSGNYLISGEPGGEREGAAERSKMVVSSIINSPNFSRDNLVIMSSDPRFLQEIIDLARNKRLGSREVVPCTSAYRLYHVFYGMSVDAVTDCLNRVGRKIGSMNMFHVMNYARTFLEVLRHYYPISLQAMLHLSRQSDSYVYMLGERAGMSSRELANLVEKSADGGKEFREILEQIYQAMGHITTPDCDTHVSITQERRYGRILLIDTRSRNPEIQNLILSYELQHIPRDFRDMGLVLNNITIFSEDGWYEALQDLLRRPEVHVGIACPDGINFLRQEGFPGFHTQVLYQHADEGHLQAFLENYRTYTHAYVTKVEHREPGIMGMFRIIPGSDFAIAKVQRNRIQLEDMRYAVVHGMEGSTPIILDYFTA